MTDLPTASISAVRRCNGMGEQCNDGSYVLMAIEHKGEKMRLARISVGDVELLLSELGGVLGCVDPARVARRVLSEWKNP